jgi:putative nucleotidyltransferase with HDIG domain
MENWINSCTDFFKAYVNSFSGLTAEQCDNFNIKKEHSLRVSDNSVHLCKKLNLSGDDCKVAFLAGLFHDIGRFRQLIEFNTFNDATSVDHAEYSVKILKERGVFNTLEDDLKNLIYFAILVHNKFQLPDRKRTERELMHACLLRDADKLDILKVVTDYYSDKNKKINHTLTWELPVGTKVSPAVAKEIRAGKLVSKQLVKNELDVKIMQLSWVYDLNFKSSFEFIFENRFFEKIFNSLPKNDLIIEIYRQVKVFSENKILK